MIPFEHKCPFEDYDHLPCMIISKILNFPGTVEDKISIAESVFINICSILGIPNQTLMDELVNIFSEYRGPWPDILTENLVYQLKQEEWECE